MPLLILLVLLIGVPLIEIAVFIEIGGILGLWLTLAVTVATAFAGAFLLRTQGLSTLAKAERELAESRMPAQTLIDGCFILIAGALLLTPGFVTDALGLLLFVPPVRSALSGFLLRQLEGRVRVRRGRGGQTIEGEWQEVTPPEDGRENGDDAPRMLR